MEDRQAARLPVPSFHPVFPFPHALNPLILSNQRLLLGVLCTAASQTLLQFGRQNLGGQLGGIMVLHTWDPLLNAPFYVHCLVPGGALADADARWVPTHPQFLFPVHALGTAFRSTFLETLCQPQTMEAVRLTEDTASLGIADGLQPLLDQLYTKEWIVYAKRPFAGLEQVVDYIGRYTHRVAIAHHRLVDIRDGQVRFTFRHRQQGNRQQIMTLEAHEFLRRGGVADLDLRIYIPSIYSNLQPLTSISGTLPTRYSGIGSVVFPCAFCRV